MKTEETTVRIETTIGDLIFAIAEAASEAEISDDDVAVLTQAILGDVLTKFQN